MSTESHNNTYLFTLVLRGVSKITIDLENDLFESGCDDALLHSNNGSIFLEFNRKDASLENAVNSAIGNVKKCKNIEVAVVEPADYVTIAEIARRASLTREYIRKLAKGVAVYPTNALLGNSSLIRRISSLVRDTSRSPSTSSK